MDITAILPVEILYYILSFLPPRKRTEVQLVNKLFCKLSRQLWSQQKSLFVQPQLVTKDLFMCREGSCRVDQTDYANFRPYLFSDTDLLVLPPLTPQDFQLIVKNIVKQASNLEYIYWVFACEFEQGSLLDGMTLSVLQQITPSLRLCQMYTRFLLAGSYRVNSKYTAKHVRFSGFIDTHISRSLRSQQVFNFRAYMLLNDIHQLLSLSLDVIPDIVPCIPLISRYATNLRSLEITVRSIISAPLLLEVFESLSSFLNIRKLKLVFQFELETDCGLDLLLEKFTKLEQFYLNQPINRKWYNALQSNANTNARGTLEVFSGNPDADLCFSPNIKKNLIITKYKSRNYRIELPGEKIKFYSYACTNSD